MLQNLIFLENNLKPTSIMLDILKLKPLKK